MSTAMTLMTAAEFARLPAGDRPRELVRGEIVEMNQPGPRHGQVCAEVVSILRNFVKEHRLGHVTSNDAGIVTERGPDTVRGADVWYISYDKVPPGPLPDTDLDLIPDLVIEVISPTDRWPRVLTKVGEYLDAGVSMVCVLDPTDETATIQTADAHPVTLTANEELTFPAILPNFAVAVKRFFE